jgi:hypothetical protein
VNRCLLILTLPALLAAAPSPLVVGSVRDQYGAPIADARVRSGDVSVQTDAQGTFALSASAVSSVTITCPYCQSLTVRIDTDEPVVALVHRFDAVTGETPSERDIAAVPYAQVESIASLRPFTVLENSSHLLPGPMLSDRGISSRGSLVFDNGIPSYDIVSNQSPFVTYPAFTVTQLSWLPPSDAFSYGDFAGGGSVFANTREQAKYGAFGSSGTVDAARLGEALSNGAWLGAYSHEQNDVRMRADGTLHIPSGDDRFDISAVTSEDRASPDSQSLNTSVSGLRLDFESARENRTDASLIFDGGGYSGTTPAIGYNAKWSDIQAQAGVTTNTRVQFFAQAGARASTGGYQTSSPALPVSAGAIMQTRVTFGAQTAGDRYSLRLGAGAFDFHYSGGAAGRRSALDGGVIVPGFTGSYAFDPHWRLDVQGGESFELPTLLEAFVYPPDTATLAFDRNLFVAETLTYGDLKRFHASVTSLSERVSGLDNGTVQSAGVSLAWQVAPTVAVRAWLLHDDDRTVPYESLYRFGVRPQPATVGSYWATYETPGMRIDAIYRRDLLDYRVDPHFDASVSTPLANGLRLFGATERRAGTRSITFGVRIESAY